MDDAAEVRRLLRQQAAIASFGSFALREGDLMKILTEAARVCAEGLNVPFCKVCRYRLDENDLLIEAGFGWKAGVIGHVVSQADESSPQGRAFITGDPAVCKDLRVDRGFRLPAFYTEHHIISTIDVVIKGAAGAHPYGVLEIDNDQQQDYDQSDINFLTGFANVLAEAVDTSARTLVMQTTIAQMKALVSEKDRLLEQKEVLAEELQHRVRNNLQLVYAMLSKQLDETSDAAGRRGLRSIARRVSTLSQVYDHLLGSGIARTADFGAYVKSLCSNIAEVQASEITLAVGDCDPIILDLDMITALGIVVAELVTNSYDHAFPDGKGQIDVSVRVPDDDAGTATLIIRDGGSGFSPEFGSKRHGLGLVRRLIEQARGNVQLEANQGTVWTIKFPVTSVITEHRAAT